MARVYQGSKLLETFYGESAQEAEDKKAAFLESRTRSIDPAPPVVTLHDFAGHVWWPTVESSCSPNTIKKYRSVYKTHIRPALGELRLVDVNFVACQGFVNRMREAGKSPNTIHNVVGQLVTILTMAVDADYITKNPATKVKLPPQPEARIRILSPAQAREVLRKLEGSDLYRAAAIALMLGLRRAEISALKWDDLDRIGCFISIRRQKVRVKGEGLINQKPKSRRQRRIKISPSIIELLDKVGDLDCEYIASKTIEARKKVEGKWREVGDKVCYDPDYITEDWAEARPKLGLDEEWHFHDLRHAAAGLLHEAGEDPITIMTILGHSNLNMTLLYTHVSDSKVGKATGKIADLFLSTGHQTGVEPTVSTDTADLTRSSLDKMAPRRGLDS